MLDSLFLQCHLASSKDLLPCRNLQFSLYHFSEVHSLLPWFLGTIGFLGGRLSQNEGQGNTQQITHHLKPLFLPIMAYTLSTT
jgi:hypothetical protein